MRSHVRQRATWSVIAAAALSVAALTAWPVGTAPARASGAVPPGIALPGTALPGTVSPETMPPGTVSTIAGGMGGPGPARGVSVQLCGNLVERGGCGVSFAGGSLYFTDLGASAGQEAHGRAAAWPSKPLDRGGSDDRGGLSGL